jgi:ribosomal protein S19
MIGVEQRGATMYDRIRTSLRREVIVPSLLGIALFVIPLAIDLARTA